MSSILRFSDFTWSQPTIGRADSHLRASREPLKALASMIHHIVLYKLKPEVTPARVEAMMMNARMQLLKIPGGPEHQMRQAGRF